jgi:uncharacterized membrane protein YbaN (DUF454 family)
MERASVGARTAAAPPGAGSARTGHPSGMQASEDPDPSIAADADTFAVAASGRGGAPSTSLPVRVFLVAVGSISLALGVVGIVVPVLPTTPFLLLAAACYARASDRMYAWLLGQPALGPIIEEWRRSRSLPPGVRTRAVVVVALSFGASILLVDSLPIRVGLAIAAAVLIVFLYRIPTRR